MRLCYHNTDFWIYEIETGDIYEDVRANSEPGTLHLKEWFDFSDYPKDHSLYDESNKKVIEKLKDKLSEKIIKKMNTFET